MIARSPMIDPLAHAFQESRPYRPGNYLGGDVFLALQAKLSHHGLTAPTDENILGLRRVEQKITGVSPANPKGPKACHVIARAEGPG